MKIAAVILTAALAMLLAGCVLRGKPKTVLAAPPPPTPAPVVAPAPPPAPLSIPQTHVELPAPQPVSAEALATTLPPEEPAPAPPVSKPPSRSGSRAAAPRTEPPAQPPAAAAPAAPEPAERPPVQELVSPEEQKQLLADMQHARQEARTILERTPIRRLNRQRQQLRQSVEEFLKLSDGAESRSDLRQARELAGRAAVLAKELQP